MIRKASVELEGDLSPSLTGSATNCFRRLIAMRCTRRPSIRVSHHGLRRASLGGFQEILDVLRVQLLEQQLDCPSVIRFGPDRSLPPS